MIKTPNSQCKGPGFNPWSGNRISHATTKTQYSQINKNKYFLKSLIALSIFCSRPGSFPGGTSSKEPACQGRREKRHRSNPCVRKIPWRRRIHSSVLAWRIPWTEEHGRLQSIGSHRVGHNWSDFAHTHCPWVWLWSQAAWAQILANFFSRASASSSVKWGHDAIYLPPKVTRGGPYAIIKHVKEGTSNSLVHFGLWKMIANWRVFTWKRQLLACLPLLPRKNVGHMLSDLLIYKKETQVFPWLYNG